MTAAQVAIAENNVNAVFAAITDWTDELLQYALANQ
jgi:hypothetical protein